MFIQSSGGGQLAQSIESSVPSVTVGDTFSFTAAASNQNSAPTFTIDIRTASTMAGGTSLISGPLTSSPNLVDGTGSNNWADVTVNATVSSTYTGPIYLVISAGGGQIRMDNLRLTYVPEPAAALLGGIATLALLGRRNRWG